MSIEEALSRLTTSIDQLNATMNADKPSAPVAKEPPQPEVQIDHPQQEEEAPSIQDQCKKLCINLGRKNPAIPKGIIKAHGADKLADVPASNLPTLLAALLAA